MSQKLSIHQFGPISHIEIEVKDLLIFIGSQASGKSTVSKAIFFFKSLRDDLTSYLYQCYNQQNFEHSVTKTNFVKRAKQKFLKIYGSVLQFPDMQLTYQYGNGMKMIVKTAADGRYIDIIFDDYFREKFRELVYKFQQLHEQLKHQSFFSSSREISAIKAQETALFEQINHELNLLFNDERDLLFLPSGRSLITILSQQRYNIDMGDDFTFGDDLPADKSIKLDYLMQSFIQRIDNAKPIFNQNFTDLMAAAIANSGNAEKQRVIRLAENIVNSILKGAYRYQNGMERIDFGNGQSTLINFASSGQQEVVWILLLILLLILNQRQVFLVIEEPEAHLFPVAQKQIIDLIALLANQTDNQVVLTTHSPYILSSFNNLLYAHKLGAEKAEKISQVVDRSLWLDSNRLDAYMLAEGNARSIMDTEIGLIESAEIDKASEIIVDIFNQLFELEDQA